MTLRFGIITASDRSYSGARPDLSGPALAQVVLSKGWKVLETQVLPDEKEMIAQTLMAWCDGNTVDVILITGGTGFAPRDVTPEATLAVIERQVPGIPEAMRMESLRQTPHAMLSRSVAGIRNQTLILNLPGSPKAAVENLQTSLPVLEHAVELMRDAPDAEKHHSSPLA